MRQFLDSRELLIDTLAQFFALAQRTSCRAGAFYVTPDQFIRIQVGGVARQEVQGQPAVGLRDVFVHDGLFMCRQAIEHQMNRLLARAHHLP